MKPKSRICMSLAFGITAAVLIVSLAASANAGVLAHGATVSSADSVIYGRTYSEWVSAWRQWSDTMQWDKHPLFDTAGCSEGQSGPVWFLGGRFCGTEQTDCDSSKVERSCTVPKGRSLFFPVLNFGCLDGEAKLGLCMDAGPFIGQMRAVAAAIIDGVDGLSVTVDGRPVKVDLMKNFRIQSTVYSTLLPSNNLYQALGEDLIVEGSYVGIDDGIFVMLDPLRRGDHTLKFTGSFPQFGFSLDVTYHLTVE